MSQKQADATSITNPIPTQPAHQLLNLPSFRENGEAGHDLNDPHLPWWRRRRGITIIVVILLVALLGGFALRVMSRKPPVSYQSQQVTQGNLAITISATGPVQNGTYNLIFSGQGGRIDEIDVTAGQKVTKGQVLARLDKTLLQDALNQAQITVNNAQTSLNAAQASAGGSQGQANASVSAAQTAVAVARANQKQVQAQSQANIDAAKTALANAQANLTNVTNVAIAQKQSATDTYKATGCDKAPPPITATCQQALDTYNSAFAQANANIAAAQAQVNTAQAQLHQAEVNANANNSAAQNQVNTAQSQLNTAQAGVSANGSSGQSQVVAAQNQLNLALAQLAQAQHNLANATLTAPHDGTVTVINGTVGGNPGVPSTAGSTTAGSAFIQIVDLSAMQVQANVNEADTANLQVGESASFTVDAYGSQQFTGTVSAIPPIGQTISNVVTYPVSIDVDLKSLHGAHLLPSMTANVTINAVQHNNVLLIPVNAVNFARLASIGNSASNTPQVISSQAATSALNQARQMLNTLEIAAPDLVSQGLLPAFVIEKSGSQFVAKPVVLGLTDGNSYEVIQGLSLGDTFLVGTNG